MEDHTPHTISNHVQVLKRVKRAVMELDLDGYIPGSCMREEMEEKYRKDRAVPRRICQRRLVSKKGRVRVDFVNVPDRGQLFLSDIFTTLIDARWRYVFLIFSLTFLASWSIFGSIWWGIYWYRKKYFHTECVEKVKSWTSAFLFSLETQTTIGYGGRQVTPECPEGVICLIIQCIIGLLISSSMLGLIFAKISKPQKRRSTVVFSRHAVVAPRDGQMCLMIRVADFRKTQLLESHIRVHLLRRYISSEGEEIGCYKRPLPFIYDGDEDCDKLPLFVPVVLVHVIDKDSPFYDYSPDDLLYADFEIVVILEGIVESTGMTMQARTSYIGEEIHWGHLFCDIMNYKDSWKGQFEVDMSRFHETFAVDLPRLTTRQLVERENHRSIEQHSQQLEMEENIDLTDMAQHLVPSGVSLIPNGGTGNDIALTKL